MNELTLPLCPQICRKLGVECDGCVQTRAHSMARISPGLTPSEAAKLFKTLYPSEGCSPMRDPFLIGYREEIELTFAVLSAPNGIRSVA
jgi:hypothetical protein